MLDFLINLPYTAAMLAGGIIIGIALYAIPVYITLYRERLHHKRIKKALGDDVTIENTFPIIQQHERIIHGVLKKMPPALRIVVTGKDWLFAQPIHRKSDISVNGDYLVANTITICAFHMNQYVPEILIEHKSLRNIMMDGVQQKIAAGELIWCEGVFEANHRVYARPEVKFDILSILSPEVLDAMQSPPYKADMYVKRDQLYYLFHTSHPVEKAMPIVMKHASRVRHELEDNLARYTRSRSNSDNVARWKNTPLALTLHEITYGEPRKKRTSVDTTPYSE